MRIVVFGAAGFVGRNVVHRLLSDRIEFTASDIIESPFENEVSYIKTDMLNYDDVKKVVKDSDVVLHLAASPLLASIKNPRQNMKINIEGTLNILDAARESGVDKVVFTSASSVIGEVHHSPVKEEHPCNPKTPYAVAKKASEDYLKVYHELFGLNYIIFRFFNVYGPWQFPESGALIPLIYTTLTSGKPFTIYGDGSAARDFIYVKDVADFILAALQKDVKNELLNMGTGTPTSIIELIKSSSRILGLNPNLVYKPKRPGEIDNFVADTSKLERIFHRKPETSLEEGLHYTFTWLADQINQ